MFSVAMEEENHANLGRPSINSVLTSDTSSSASILKKRNYPECALDARVDEMAAEKHDYRIGLQMKMAYDGY